MKIVTGFKLTCDEIVTNFKTAISSILVSFQLGAQFSLHMVLKFAYISSVQPLVLVTWLV